MLSNSQLKYIKSLALKKFRLKHNRFLCEGDKIVKELLESQFYRIELLCALPEWMEDNSFLLQNKDLKQLEVSNQELKKISSLKTPNKVLAVAEMHIPNPETASIANQLCLYLDNLQDPGNMGTILRIADWFGIRWIFTSHNTVDLYNPKVIQATMGAFLRVNVLEKELREIKKNFPEKKIYAADMKGKNIFSTPLDKNSLIVIGNEGGGISTDNFGWIDQFITIPSAAGGGAESLNAGVAAGIICACFRNL